MYLKLLIKKVLFIHENTSARNPDICYLRIACFLSIIEETSKMDYRDHLKPRFGASADPRIFRRFSAHNRFSYPGIFPTVDPFKPELNLFDDANKGHPKIPSQMFEYTHNTKAFQSRLFQIIYYQLFKLNHFYKFHTE